MARRGLSGEGFSEDQPQVGAPVPPAPQWGGPPGGGAPGAFTPASPGSPLPPVATPVPNAPSPVAPAPYQPPAPYAAPPAFAPVPPQPVTPAQSPLLAPAQTPTAFTPAPPVQMAPPPAQPLPPQAPPMPQQAPLMQPMPPQAGPMPQQAPPMQPMPPQAGPSPQMSPPPQAGSGSNSGDFWGEPQPVGPPAVDNSVFVQEETAYLSEPEVAPEKPVKRKRRAGDIIMLLLAVLLLAGGGVIGYLAWQNYHDDSGTFPDMTGHRIAPDDETALDPGFVEASNTVDDVGLRFVIESVGLDVPLGETNEVNGLINPPGFTSVYRVRNRGVPLDEADKGTVWITAHSVRSPGMAPGNYVIDIPNRAVALQVGAMIQVGNLTYQVASTEIIPKAKIGEKADIWANNPGMLVFITCLQYPNASDYNGSSHSRDNVVIVAQLVS